MDVKIQLLLMLAVASSGQLQTLAAFIHEEWATVHIGLETEWISEPLGM